jgi:poly [ADP-ribose] polymerase
MSTRKNMHTCSNLRVGDIYSVKINGMEEKFNDTRKNIDNVLELWHGSKASNLLSIMKKGLIIPPANSSYCTGRMFGNGIYASNTSTKAAGYSYGYWGGNSCKRFFVFLLDMAMGKAYKPTSSYDNFPAKGYDSTHALPGTCGVINDECIVYDVSQVNLKYLVELK